MLKEFIQGMPARLRRLLFVKSSLYVYSLFMIRMAGTAASVLYTVILGRLYGAQGAGLFYIYRSWTDIFGNQLTGNYQSYVTRKAVFLQEDGRTRSAITLVNTVALGVAAVSFFVWGTLLVLPVSRLIAAVDLSTARILLLLAGCSGGMFLIVQNLSAGLRAFNSARATLVLQVIIPPGIACLGLIVAANSPSDRGPLYPAFIFTFSYVVAAVAAILIWRRVAAAHAGEGASDQLGAAKITPRDMINAGALAFLVGGWISLLLENLPFYFLSVAGTLTEIAYYGVADRLVSISSTVLYSLASDYAPRFARLYAQHDADGLRREFFKSQFYGFLLFAPFLAALLFFPRVILGLFGRGFVDATAYLLILLVGDAINAGTGLVSPLLYAMGDEVFVLRFQAVGLVLLAASLFLGWKELGGLGVAVAASFFQAISNIICFLRAVYLLRRLPGAV